MSAPPGFDPNVSLLKGAGDSAPPPVIAMRGGGGLPNNYVEGGYKDSLLPGGNGPIQEMHGGAITREQAKEGTEVVYTKPDGSKVKGVIVGQAPQLLRGEEHINVSTENSDRHAALALRMLDIDNKPAAPTTTPGSTAANNIPPVVNPGPAAPPTTPEPLNANNIVITPGPPSGPATSSTGTTGAPATGPKNEFAITLEEFLEVGGTEEQYNDFINKYAGCLKIGITGGPEGSDCSTDGNDYMEKLRMILVKRLESYSRECKFFQATEGGPVSISKSKPAKSTTPGTSTGTSTNTSTGTSTGTSTNTSTGAPAAVVPSAPPFATMKGCSDIDPNTINDTEWRNTVLLFKLIFLIPQLAVPSLKNKIEMISFASSDISKVQAILPFITFNLHSKNVTANSVKEIVSIKNMLKYVFERLVDGTTVAGPLNRKTSGALNDIASLKQRKFKGLKALTPAEQKESLAIFEDFRSKYFADVPKPSITLNSLDSLKQLATSIAAKIDTMTLSVDPIYIKTNTSNALIYDFPVQYIPDLAKESKGFLGMGKKPARYMTVYHRRRDMPVDVPYKFSFISFRPEFTHACHTDVYDNAPGETYAHIEDVYKIVTAPTAPPEPPVPSANAPATPTGTTGPPPPGPNDPAPPAPPYTGPIALPNEPPGGRATVVPLPNDPNDPAPGPPGGPSGPPRPGNLAAHMRRMRNALNRMTPEERERARNAMRRRGLGGPGLARGVGSRGLIPSAPTSGTTTPSAPGRFSKFAKTLKNKVTGKNAMRKKLRGTVAPNAANNFDGVNPMYEPDEEEEEVVPSGTTTPSAPGRFSKFAKTLKNKVTGKNAMRKKLRGTVAPNAANIFNELNEPNDPNAPVEYNSNTNVPQGVAARRKRLFGKIPANNAPGRFSKFAKTLKNKVTGKNAMRKKLRGTVAPNAANIFNELNEPNDPNAPVEYNSNTNVPQGVAARRKRLFGKIPANSGPGRFSRLTRRLRNKASNAITGTKQLIGELKNKSTKNNASLNRIRKRRQAALAAEERAARPQITPAPPVRRNLPRNEGVQFNPFATPEERARGERAALLAAAATRRAAPTPVAPTTVTPAVAPTGRNLSLTPKTPISNNTRRALNGLMNARKNAAARAAVPAATLTIPTIKEPSVISKTAKKLKNKASTALNATRNKLSELKPKKTPQRNRKPENKSGLERPNIRPPTPAPNNQQARNLLNFGQEPRI